MKTIAVFLFSASMGLSTVSHAGIQKGEGGLYGGGTNTSNAGSGLGGLKDGRLFMTCGGLELHSTSSQRKGEVHYVSGIDANAVDFWLLGAGAARRVTTELHSEGGSFHFTLNGKTAKIDMVGARDYALFVEEDRTACVLHRD